MKRMLAAAAAVLGLASAGWLVLTRVQGDSDVVVDGEELASVTVAGTGVSGHVRLTNRGRQIAVVRRVEGRLLTGSGAVHVTRLGSRPPERGWWVSNLLAPGESCVAEVDIELTRQPDDEVTVELMCQEIGRRPLITRVSRIRVPLPATTPGSPGLDHPGSDHIVCGFHPESN